MKRANGMGTIIKLTGNRRRPWAIRRVIGYKENGHAIIKYQGYYRTKREAEQALNAYNADPYTINKITLSEIYKEWYAYKEQEKTQGTLRSYRALYAHLEPLHDIRLHEIDRNVLQQFYDNLNTSANTLQRIMQFLGMIFEYSVRRNIMPISALNLNKAVVIPVKEVTRRNARTVISKEDINKLWEIKDESEYAKIILVYIYTGVRYSELRGLTPDCWHENYFEVKQAKTKAGVRVVPICDKIKCLLPIMPVPAHTTFDRQFKWLLPDHSIHETRHTFITMMTEAGCDPRVLKAIVGHKSSDITEYYTHISLDVMLEAVNRL